MIDEKKLYRLAYAVFSTGRLLGKAEGSRLEEAAEADARNALKNLMEYVRTSSQLKQIGWIHKPLPMNVYPQIIVESLDGYDPEKFDAVYMKESAK